MGERQESSIIPKGKGEDSEFQKRPWQNQYAEKADGFQADKADPMALEPQEKQELP